MKQLLISLLLLAGLSACSGEKGKEAVVSAPVETPAPPADTLENKHTHTATEAALSPEMQHHVHEIDSLLEGI